jgi:hypothetical protein
MRKKGAGQATDDATAAATDSDLISVLTPAASVQWLGASWSDYGAPYGVWTSIPTSITSSASGLTLMTSSGDALGPASMLDPEASPSNALLSSAPAMFQLAAFGASGGWTRVRARDVVLGYSNRRLEQPGHTPAQGCGRKQRRQRGYCWLRQ